MCEPTHVYPVPIPSAPGNSVSVARLPSHIEAPSAHVSWPMSDAPWAGLALLTTSLEVVQAIIYDRVLEAGI